MKKIKYLTTILTILFSLSTISLGQANCENPFVLKEKRPSVYITFEKFGKRTFRHFKESNEGVWLRLHNNSKFDVLITTNGTDEKEHGDYTVYHRVEVTSE